jgi:hypothetical protein
MGKFAVLSVLIGTLLAGCGQVIVFGHVIGERKESAQPSAEASPATAGSAAGTSGTAAAQAANAAHAQPAAAGADASAPAAAVAPAATRVAARAPAITHAVKAVNITVTPEAAAKVTGDASRFAADALLDAIRTELKARKLLDEESPQASGTAEIIVDDLATRPTSNAILFGYKMLAGTLEGDVRVTGAEGTESTGSRIIAESKLTVAANGNDKNPLGPLYRRFAVLAADRLAGVESRPPDPTGPPRF